MNINSLINQHLWMQVVLILCCWFVFFIIAILTRKTMGRANTIGEICFLIILLELGILFSPILWIIKISVGIAAFIVGVVAIAILYPDIYV